MSKVTPEQLQALTRYAGKHGKGWKSKLLGDWMMARAEPCLHALRNTLGPTGLSALDLQALREEHHGKS